MEKDKSIPEIVITENKVVLPTKEVPITINGKEETIVMQKLSSGSRRDISKAHLSTKIVGQQLQANADVMSFQIGILSKVIKEAPFEVSEAMIASFPDDVIDYLYQEYAEWASDSKKKD